MAEEQLEVASQGGARLRQEEVRWVRSHEPGWSCPFCKCFHGGAGALCALPCGLHGMPGIFPMSFVSVSKRSCVLQRELYGERWGGRCPLCRAIALSLEKCVFRSFPKLFFFVVVKVLTAVNIIWFTWSLE